MSGWSVHTDTNKQRLHHFRRSTQFFRAPPPSSALRYIVHEVCPLMLMEGVDFTLDSWLPSHDIHGYSGFPWLYGDGDHGVFLPWMWERNRNVWFVGGFPFVCRLAAGAICVGALCVVGRCLLWRLGQWRKWLKRRPLSSSPRPEPVGDKLAELENFPVNVIIKPPVDEP